MVECLEQSTQQIRRIETKAAPYRLSDAHCHLDLYPNPEEIVEEAWMKGLERIITAGSNRESNLKTLDIAKGSVAFAVVGISPDFSGGDFEFIDELAEIIKRNRNIVGVGEVGLDFKIVGRVPAEIQKQAFLKQIEIAKALEVPLVIHSRGALNEVVEILERSEVERAVLHFFEGDEEQAKALEKRGYLISIPPVRSGRRRRVIKALDINSIVSETDAPVVGKTPLDVMEVVEEIAGIKNIGLGEVSELITETIKDYFYI